MAYHISKFQVFSFGGFGVFVHRKKVVKKCNVVVHQAFQIRKLQKFLIRKVFNRKKKKQKKTELKKKKRCQSSQKLNVGAETTSPGGRKFEIFILLPRLVFEELRFEPSIGLSVFMVENPYHETDCLKICAKVV